MKIVKLFLLGILGLFFFIVIAIVFFAEGEKSYKEKQDDYFSKIDYEIRGKILSYKLLGGRTYLIEISIDSFVMNKNMLTESDDFVGLYSAHQKKAFILASYELDQEFSEHEIRNDTLPSIIIESLKREIKYNTTPISLVGLRSNNIYKDRLLKIETNEMIRF